MRDAPRLPQSDVLEAMRSLAIDGVTAEVSAAFKSAGVPFILLKGPVITRWLYADGDRGYSDSDLLIPRRQEGLAENVLSALGFRAASGTGWPDPGVARNHTWTRGAAIVELHVTLTGIGVSPDDVWASLSRDTESIAVRDQAVRILALPARLLHVALHAAQHGPEFGKALRDLELATAAHGVDDWRAAAALAAQVRAVDALSAGLDLVAAAREIKVQLALPEPSDPLVLLRAQSASPVALGLARFAGESARNRARHARRVLLPTPAFLRWWTPIASRGALGLVAAYGWRYAYLAGELPDAIRRFRRARRTSQDGA